MRCTGTPVQTGQDQPLPARDAQTSHAAIELRPQEPGHIRNHDPNIFVSIRHAAVVAVGKLVMRTSGANYSRMTEMITPYNRALATPGLTGAWDFNTVPGLAKVAKEIARQSMMIGYLNAF